MSKSDIALATLIKDDKKTLWLVPCQRETLRLLRYAHDLFTESQIQTLADSILEGPPRSLFKEMSDDEWHGIKSHAIMHRLIKLQTSGAVLPERATATLVQLQEQYSDKSFREGEGNIDEFPVYSWTGWLDKNTGSSENQLDSMNEEEFEAWATNEKERRWDDYRDQWGEYCKNNPAEAYEKLAKLASRNIWPAKVWSIALCCFHQKMIAKDNEKNSDLFSEDFFEKVIQSLHIIPEDIIRGHSNLAKEVAHFIGFKIRDSHEPDQVYWDIWDKVWQASLNDETLRRDALIEVSQASGQLSEQLLQILSNRKPEKGQGIPSDLEERFLQIVNAHGNGGLVARFMLISRLLFMFYISPEWSKEHLIPFLSRSHVPNEWKQMWLGFMWSPRVSPNLFAAIKSDFRDVLNHIDEFDENYKRRIFQLFSFLLLPSDSYFSKSEAKLILTSLDPKWLLEVVRALMSQLINTGESDAPKMWREQMEPWFKVAWPRTRQAKEGKVSVALAEMALYCFDAFPECVETISPYIGPGDLQEVGTFIFILLKNKQRHLVYPDAALKLLSVVVAKQPLYGNGYLKEILDKIIEVKPELKITEEYRHLKEISGI